MLDFAVGEGAPASLGHAAAVSLQEKLPENRFILLERSQLERIVKENDLSLAGLTSDDAARRIGTLSQVSHLVLGSVESVDGVGIHARLVDVSSGRVWRQGRVALHSFPTLDEAMMTLAGVLAASDQQYQQLNEQIALEQQQAVTQLGAPRIRCERRGSDLVVSIRADSDQKSDLVMLRETRQKMRECFAEYCRTTLGRRDSKDSLMDYCRSHEECDDVRDLGNSKEYVFHIPLPDQ